jgi:hypothetical protein
MTALALSGCGAFPPGQPAPSATQSAIVNAPAPKAEAAVAPKKEAPVVAAAAPGAPKAPAKPEGPAVAKPPVAPSKPAAPAVAASRPAPAQSLDIPSLEQRLKDTPAIGLMTKLSLKNQVDDLLAQFRAYHQGHRPPTLEELRRPYELLLMKLLALLQDQDPGLAAAIHDSRDAIWGVLSDRDKFSKFA